MRLYRYRPITPSLFKELRYQEVYLAPYTELNDPLDLAPVVDFRAKNLDEGRFLVHFLLKRIFVSRIVADLRGGEREIDGRSNEFLALIDTLKDEKKLTTFANAILDEMNRLYDTDTVITNDRVFHVLKRLLTERGGEFPFVADLEALREGIDATLNAFLNNSHVTCFSSRNDGYLLWSHYSGGHQGICMEFDLSGQSESECDLPLEMWNHPKFGPYERPDPITNEGYRFHLTARKVSYVDVARPVRFYDFLPVFTNERDSDLRYLSKSRWHLFADRLSETFLEKSTQWSHEAEWRIVEVRFLKDEVLENRILRYNIDALKGIIFGCRTSEEIRRRVHAIVRLNSDSVVFYQATLRDDGGIAVAEISPEDWEDSE